MRPLLPILILAAAVAGCGDRHSTEPTDPPPRDLTAAGDEAAAVRQPVFCANSRVYPLTENTWELAFTSVNGHSLPGVASDGGTFDYSLDITPQIASDLQQSAIQGCGAKLTFITSGEVGVLGNGEASFTAATHVVVRAFTQGAADINRTFKDGYKAPPLPSGCTTIVCIVSKQRIVVIPTAIQTVFQPGGRISVHSDATAHVNARGTSVWDQSLSSFSIPHGSGRNPDGPLLVITFP